MIRHVITWLVVHAPPPTSYSTGLDNHMNSFGSDLQIFMSKWKHTLTKLSILINLGFFTHHYKSCQWHNEGCTLAQSITIGANMSNSEQNN